MRIRAVTYNNRRKVFEIVANGRRYAYPYRMALRTSEGPAIVRDAFVDPELGHEGFTYVLDSGREGSIHLDHVLEYNEEPGYMADLVLHRLTVEANRRLLRSGLSKRELIRRLHTSAPQLYRLLDPANRRKSIRQMLELLFILECEVDLVVRTRRKRRIA